MGYQTYNYEADQQGLTPEQLAHLQQLQDLYKDKPYEGNRSQASFFGMNPDTFGAAMAAVMGGAAIGGAMGAGTTTGTGTTGYFAGATPAELVAANAGNATMGTGGLGSMAALGGDTAAGMTAGQAATLAKGVGGSMDLGSIGGFLKDNANWLLPLAGAAAGSQSQTQSTNKDPWSPAQPYLLDNLKQNAAMQAYYHANPFSQEQKAAYQGLLDTNANGLANAGNYAQIANNFMGSKRGLMADMPTLTTGAKAAPIDWSKYANIGKV